MKTMRAPKMDVVRFTESDVIVASGNEIVNLSNLGDGKYANNTVSGDGFNLTFDGIQHGSYAHIINTGSTFNNGSSAKTLWDLIIETDNDGDNSNSNFNGTYEWSNGQYIPYSGA